MKVVVKKWKTALRSGFRHPYMESAHVGLEQSVDVREEKGRIIIEPVRTGAFDLDELLRGITPENGHSPVEFGIPVGKEWP